MHICRKLAFIAIFLVFPLLASSQIKDLPRFEAGLQYTVQGDMGSSGYYVESNVRQHGVGARFVYNVNRFVALEGEWNIFPEKGIAYYSTQYGGRSTEGLFGVKAGWRNRKFGFFGRVAPGYLSYGKALQSDSSYPWRYGRVTHSREYYGAVAEYYPNRRVALRYDMGQTFTKYGAYNVFPSEWRRDGQISAGVLYRF